MKLAPVEPIEAWPEPRRVYAILFQETNRPWYAVPTVEVGFGARPRLPVPDFVLAWPVPKDIHSMVGYDPDTALRRVRLFWDGVWQATCDGRRVSLSLVEVGWLVRLGDSYAQTNSLRSPVYGPLESAHVFERARLGTPWAEGSPGYNLRDGEVVVRCEIVGDSISIVEPSDASLGV